MALALIGFDLDGVLQRNPFRPSREDGVFGHIKRELAPFIRRATHGHGNDAGEQSQGPAEAQALSMVLQEHQARLEAERWVEAYDWDGIVAAVAGRVGYTGPPIDVARLVREYCERPGLVSSYPGARECLQALRDAGHRLVAITNGFRCYQEPVLRKLGLWEFFDGAVTPESAGAVKPQPEIFRAAESAAVAVSASDGTARRATGDLRAATADLRIHVGDTLRHDIAGANLAGWIAVFIAQSPEGVDASLPQVLRELPPWERPAHPEASGWLQARMQRELRWYEQPQVPDSACVPAAMVFSLGEIPGLVEAIAGRRSIPAVRRPTPPGGV